MTNLKNDTGKTLKHWAILVDHFTLRLIFFKQDKLEIIISSKGNYHNNTIIKIFSNAKKRKTKERDYSAQKYSYIYL